MCDAAAATDSAVAEVPAAIGIAAAKHDPTPTGSPAAADKDTATNNTAVTDTAFDPNKGNALAARSVVINTNRLKERGRLTKQHPQDVHTSSAATGSPADAKAAAMKDAAPATDAAVAACVDARTTKVAATDASTTEITTVKDSAIATDVAAAAVVAQTPTAMDVHGAPVATLAATRVFTALAADAIKPASAQNTSNAPAQAVAAAALAVAVIPANVRPAAPVTPAAPVHRASTSVRKAPKITLIIPKSMSAKAAPRSPAAATEAKAAAAKAAPASFVAGAAAVYVPCPAVEMSQSRSGLAHNGVVQNCSAVLTTWSASSEASASCTVNLISLLSVPAKQHLP